MNYADFRKSIEEVVKHQDWFEELDTDKLFYRFMAEFCKLIFAGKYNPDFDYEMLVGRCMVIAALMDIQVNPKNLSSTIEWRSTRYEDCVSDTMEIFSFMAIGIVRSNVFGLVLSVMDIATYLGVDYQKALDKALVEYKNEENFDA